MNENSLANLKPFQPGQSGNPGGKTSAHRQSEIEAAELAAKVQLRMMKAVDEKITQLETALDAPDPYAALLVIKADFLRLIKDAQDRGYGAPVQVLDNTSSDGTMTPTVINLVPVGKPENKPIKPD